MNGKLKKITWSKLMKLTKTKKLVFYGYNCFLLDQCKTSDISKNISLLIDNNTFLWNQEVTIEKKKFTIHSPEAIKKLDALEYSVIIVAPYYKKLYSQLRMINPDIEIFFIMSKEDKLALRYDFFFKKSSVKNIIMFRSGKDNLEAFDYDDNSKTFYEYLLKKDYHRKYKFVWIVKEPSDYKFLKSKHTDVISYEWEKVKNPLKAFKYEYYVHYAKFCFFTDTCYWMRNHSDSQILVSLWHGCGFKNRSQKTEPTGTHYNYMTVNSEMYAELHSRLFGCDISQMLVTGLPKQDLILQNEEIHFLDSYNISQYDKIIFWLPTFRNSVNNIEHLNADTFKSENGFVIFDTDEKMHKLDCFLQKNNILILVKIHPNQKKDVINLCECRNIRLLNIQEMKQSKININELLRYSDALISDYSSVAVDYLLLDKPIAFITADIDEYNSKRGFAFDNITDYLPGLEIKNEKDFFGFIEEIKYSIDSTKSKRRDLTKVMHKFTDGLSCQRIEEFFFKENFG